MGFMKYKVRYLLKLIWWYTRHWKCAFLGHYWVSEGGRACPKLWEDCSQTIYICARCGEGDYGQEGGPSWKECNDCRNDWVMEDE